MASVARSTLSPAPQPLTYPLLLAVGLHLMVIPAFACAGLLERLRPPPKIVEPEAMEVSMLVMKKSNRLPTRATRPRENRGTTSEKVPSQEPVPVRQSDLALHTPEAKPTEGKPDQSAERNRAMRELTMAAALSDFDEADSARDASSPDGTGDETIDLGGRGMRADPELAKYIAQLQRLFNQHFRPLPSVVAGNPNLRTRVRIAFDDSGALTGYDVVNRSGNASYDRSAESAVQAVSRVPLPPEKYRDQSFVVEFSPP
jgi:TonB family protein